jgi:hypothetical protein
MASAGFEPTNLGTRGQHANPAAHTCPVLDSSSCVPILTLPAELASILLLAFSLVTLVPHYRTVCVQKALIYQLNFTIFVFVT